MDIANTSDPPEDHQEPSNESDSTPVHDPRSSELPELQEVHVKVGVGGA